MLINFSTFYMGETSVEIERITKHDKKNSYRVKKNYIEKKGDNYLELLQNKGFRRRIYMVDVKEYGIILK